MSYVLLRVDTEKDSPEKLIGIIEDLFTTKNDNNQTTLTNNKCSKCGKIVDQKVINFCKVKYNGTNLCRECQGEQ